MIHIAENKEDEIIDITFSGKIAKEDYDKVNELIENHRRQFNQINMLIDVREFSWDSLKAMLEDLKLSIKYFSDFTKLAIVTEKKWLELTTEIIDEVIPAFDIKMFHFDKRDSALNWLKT